MANGGFACASIVVALGLSPASAATLTATPIKDNKVIISLAGEIVDGDAEKLKEIIRSHNDAGRVVSAVRFNSPGGLLVEGVKLASIIRYGKIATSVQSGARCASACFVAFSAGPQKFVSYTANVGVHGASDARGQEAGDATVSMARVVKELGVPEGIIGKMVITPPNEIVWLWADDLRSMGATMTGKPAQAPPDQITTPQQVPSESRAVVGAPLQLPSAPSRGAPGSASPPSWKDLVAAAVALSKEQNGGSARFGRSCQPNLKVCTTAVLFRGKDGLDVMVKATEDMNGRPLQHELCTFNDFKDVRTCVDWESGASHRDMKDKSGEWQEVSQ
jgi:hypothetical protein